MSTNNTIIRNPRFESPRSAYIHVPFCRHRCGYCNFTLVARRDDLIDQYLMAIDRELSQLKTPRAIDTLFFGGGTPTHLPPASLRNLIATVRQWFPLASDYEFSVEANPLDITPERIAVLQGGGVTRLSLGVQSFHDRWLQLLERDHRETQLAEIISLAKRSFAAVSLDLIYGLPDQTLDDWRSDVEIALRFAPQHLSVYGLTFERGTSFWSRLQRDELRRCPEERELNMYELAIEMLTAANYEHYEVSNFARPGFRCRHNESYWTGRTYYAAGPGAARHIDGRREVNHRSTTTYLRRVLSGESPVAESENLTREESARERFVFGLRRLAGIDVEGFVQEVGLEIKDLFGQSLERFIAMGFLEHAGNCLRLTRSGLLISDAMWPELLNPSIAS